MNPLFAGKEEKAEKSTTGTDKSTDITTTDTTTEIASPR
jgi:hypothetical protein